MKFPHSIEIVVRGEDEYGEPVNEEAVRCRFACQRLDIAIAYGLNAVSQYVPYSALLCAAQTVGTLAEIEGRDPDDEDAKAFIAAAHAFCVKRHR